MIWDNKFTMKIDSFKLRKLRTALEVFRKNKINEYEEKTKSYNKKKNATELKSLALHIEKPKGESRISTYYINGNSSIGGAYGYGFSSYEIDGLIETLTNIANRTDKKLYEAQTQEFAKQE